MAYRLVYYFTDLPTEIADIIDKDIQKYDANMSTSQVLGFRTTKKVRNSDNTWIDETSWITGFLWHYIEKGNRENFLYDLTNIDGTNIQYTRYSKGQFYKSHFDETIQSHFKPIINIPMSNHTTLGVGAKIGGDREQLMQPRIDNFVNTSTESVRKLSFVYQLTDSDEYEGGNLVFYDDNGNKSIAPRIRGSIILFDSRTRHEVTEVTKGVRKSLVGWVNGPRWR